MTQSREAKKYIAESTQIPVRPASVIAAIILGSSPFVLQLAHAILFQLIIATFESMFSSDVSAQSFAILGLGAIISTLLFYVIIPFFLLANIWRRRNWARWVFTTYALLLIYLYLSLSYVFLKPHQNISHTHHVSVAAEGWRDLLYGTLLAASVIVFFLPASNRWFRRS